MTSFELHLTAGPLADGADTASESSFPERHFSPSPPSDTDGGSKSAGTKLHMIDGPSATSSWAHGWPGQNPPLLHRNLTPSHGRLVDSAIFSTSLPPTASPAGVEWAPFASPVAKGTDIELELQQEQEHGSRSARANSKRLAHKLSEKTRRTRLTIAIREIQKLLAEEAGRGGGDGGPARSLQDGGDAVFRPGVPSSKLDVVEMAVGVIRDLKERNTLMAERVRDVERRLGECRCRAAEGTPGTLDGLSTSGSDDEERQQGNGAV
ncbi:hypothetical protein BT67DRAFT_303822 [Trichocladium antarcticum]|uniref:BHLH domain-containing protein n=1 Tax=Trichocladium antarcticum TaxID=1450529 RepID=A0AAN6UKK7_9PEZI|nr:hypothetical protein BT67DRAFT_303822 [Trichocladium antarcticum]